MKRRPRQYFLADIKKNMYDTQMFKSFKDATRICMTGQCFDDEKFFSVVPLSRTQILKMKMRKGRIL